MTNYGYVLSVAAASPLLIPSSRRLLPRPSLVMRPGSVLVRNAYLLLCCAPCLCVCVCACSCACALRLPAGLSRRPLGLVAVTSPRIRLMIGHVSGEEGGPANWTRGWAGPSGTRVFGRPTPTSRPLTPPFRQSVLPNSVHRTLSRQLAAVNLRPDQLVSVGTSLTHFFFFFSRY